MSNKIGYELNVWNMKPYKSNKDHWVIDLYTLLDSPTGEYVTGDWIEGARIELTQEDAEALTLGKINGDYIAAQDFYITPSSFLKVFRHIPERVRQFVEAFA